MTHYYSTKPWKIISRSPCSISAEFNNGRVSAVMISISTANSNQTIAANRETTTSAKTVRMKDILALRKAVKYVENQVTTFNCDLRNPTLWQRPNANSLMRVLTDIDTVSARVKQLAGKIEISSYPHHASKMANLEKIKVTIDTLSKSASASFNRSQKNMQVIREREEQYLENRAKSARARSERRQYIPNKPQDAGLST